MKIIPAISVVSDPVQDVLDHPEPWELDSPKADSPTPSDTSASLVESEEHQEVVKTEVEAISSPATSESKPEVAEDKTKEEEVIHDDFPIRLFPPIITKIVTALYQTRLYPIGYTVMAILFAISVILGKGCTLVTNLGDTMANLYIAFVGPKGEDKTRPILWATEPLVAMDRKAQAQYKRELKEYRNAVSNHIEGVVPPDSPTRYIMSNSTDEALLKQLGRCPEGVGLRQDELTDLLKQSGRYTQKGSDLYLSLFSGASMEVDRATKDEVFFIERPYVSLIGGIQPDRFFKVFRGERMASGLFDRMLLVVRNGYTAKLWDLESTPKTSDIDGQYANLLHRLLDTAEWQGKYQLDSDAKISLQMWQNEKEHALERDGSDIQIGVFRKMQVYALKFALLLQILWDLESGKPNTKHIISAQNAIRATVLADHFFSISAAMAEEIAEPKVSAREAKLINALPEVFSAKEGFNIAKKMGIGKTQYYHLLGILGGKVLERPSRGRYIKKYPSTPKSATIYKS